MRAHQKRPASSIFVLPRATITNGTVCEQKIRQVLSFLHCLCMHCSKGHLDGAGVLVGHVDGMRLGVRDQLPHPRQPVPAALRSSGPIWVPEAETMQVAFDRQACSLGKMCEDHDHSLFAAAYLCGTPSGPAEAADDVGHIRTAAGWVDGGHLR